MVIPMFELDYEDMSVEELVKERQKIVRRMKVYEDVYILKVKPPKVSDDVVICPSPDVIYSIENENLIMLTRLIMRKLNKNYIEDYENIYFYLTVIYMDDSSKKQYNYISEDRTVKVGDIVVVERKDKKVFARVVDAKVYKQSNVPYPVSKTKYIEEKIRFDDRVEVTKDNFDDIDYEDVIALSMAEGGAMGEPNGLIVVTGDLRIYHLNLANTKIPLKKIKNKLIVLDKFECDFWGTSISEEGWNSFDLGMGNHLLIRKEYRDYFSKMKDTYLGRNSEPYMLYVTWLYLIKEVILNVWGDNWGYYRV